jgi:hypothetical protein
MKRLIWAATAATLAAGAAADTPPAEAAYQPLAYLVGHCWRGAAAGSKVSDEHCFSWVFEGKFVRDVHVLTDAGGKVTGRGESIYLWDSAAHELQYLYIESGGGFSRGTLTAQESTLVFPPTHYVEDGQEQVYRSHWQRAGADAYDVVTEFRGKAGWMPGFSVHMQKVPAP